MKALRRAFSSCIPPPSLIPVTTLARYWVRAKWFPTHKRNDPKASSSSAERVGGGERVVPRPKRVLDRSVESRVKVADRVVVVVLPVQDVLRVARVAQVQDAVPLLAVRKEPAGLVGEAVEVRPLDEVLLPVLCHRRPLFLARYAARANRR